VHTINRNGEEHMEPEHIAAHVRERSGLDVQAVTLVRASASENSSPWVWAAMTEYGHFWAVENGATIELFRAVARRTSPDDLLACHSAVEAARRFMLLHPQAPSTRVGAILAEPPQESPAAGGDQPAVSSGVMTCQSCGAAFTFRRQRHSLDGASHLCARCRHAERERRRYQQDPNYRARRLAYSAARYRQSQEPPDAAD
jgi:hypothetical protein